MGQCAGSEVCKFITEPQQRRFVLGAKWAESVIDKQLLTERDLCKRGICSIVQQLVVDVKAQTSYFKELLVPELPLDRS
jgi:hypothetical protein